jgi:hypothetical protein
MGARMDAEISRLFARPAGAAAPGRTGQQESRMPSKKPAEASTNPQAVRIKQLRQWIAAAELDGYLPGDMLLRLTCSDAAALKRHPDVAVHEVSFAMGEMRFMGVKVQEGAVTNSVLELSAV